MAQVLDAQEKFNQHFKNVKLALKSRGLAVAGEDMMSILFDGYRVILNRKLTTYIYKGNKMSIKNAPC